MRNAGEQQTEEQTRGAEIDHQRQTDGDRAAKKPQNKTELFTDIP